MTNAEIQVGEYIRTKDGYIGKLVGQYNNYFEFDNIIEYRGGQYLNSCYFDTIETSKHSFNIIDLIQEGDYVNGKRVLEKIGNMFLKVSSNDLGNNRIFDYMIKTIVTHEQMEAMEYKVGVENAKN